MSFKISTPPACDHCTVTSIDYISGDGNFGSGPYCQISMMNAVCIICVDLQLEAGWNFVSLPLTPLPVEPLRIFDEVISDVNIVKSREGVCIPNLICEISEWDCQQGYKIYMNSARSVEVCGEPCNLSMPLSSGWNWISAPTCCLPVEDAISACGSCIIIVKGMSGFYIPGVINSLGDMCPFEGYSVYLECECDLVYPICQLFEAKSHPSINNSSFSNNLVKPTEDYHPVVVRFGDDIKINSIIEIRTAAGLLVGTGKYEGEQLGILAWKDDPQTVTIDGWVTGESIEIVLVDPETNQKRKITSSENEDLFVFGETPYTIVKVGEYLDDNSLLPTLSLSTNYPNPFNPVTTIGFSLPTTGHVEISIYNIQGQHVRTIADKIYSSGFHEITWNGTDENEQVVASGLYFYKLETSKGVITKKMLLLK